jgi:CspA family cold shock protein
MKTGKVKSYVDKSAYGFLTAEDGSGDTFVHANQLQEVGLETLVIGQKVSYCILINNKNKKTYATDIKLITPQN